MPVEESSHEEFNAALQKDDKRKKKKKKREGRRENALSLQGGKFKAININVAKLKLHYIIFAQKILISHKVKAHLIKRLP